MSSVQVSQTRTTATSDFFTRSLPSGVRRARVTVIFVQSMHDTNVNFTETSQRLLPLSSVCEQVTTAEHVDGDEEFVMVCVTFQCLCLLGATL